MDMKKLWPEMMVILGGLTDVFHGQISTFIVGHPTVAMGISAVLMLLSKIQQSPIEPSK